MPNPLVVQTAQAAVLSATSNIIAQTLDSYQTNSPFQLRLEPLIQFVLFSIVSTPPNCLWQQYLEETFPGTKKDAASNKEKDEGKAPKKQSLDVGNTVKKFVLDQTLGAAFNTYIFIIFMKGINGKDMPQILEACKQDAFPLWVAGLKVWPLVSILNFTLVPVESRVLFASAVGVLWGIYLSLLAAKA